MKRIVSVLLAAFLAGLSPGLQGYQALAQVVESGASSVPAGSGALAGQAAGVGEMEGTPEIVHLISSEASLPPVAAGFKPAGWDAPIRHEAVGSQRAIARPRFASPAPISASLPAPDRRAGVSTFLPLSVSRTGAAYWERKADDPVTEPAGDRPAGAGDGEGAAARQEARFDGALPPEEERSFVSVLAQGKRTEPEIVAAAFRKTPQWMDIRFPPAPAPGSYKAPVDIARTRGAFFALHVVFMAAAAAALVAGLGLPGFLAGAGLAFVRRADFARRYLNDDGMSGFNGQLYGEKLEDFKERGEGILTILVERLGLPRDRTPRFEVRNSGGDRVSATSRGRAFDDSPTVELGESYYSQPAEEMAFAEAHELGHLYHEDSGEGLWMLRRSRFIYPLMALLSNVVLTGLPIKAAFWAIWRWMALPSAALILGPGSFSAGFVWIFAAYVLAVAAVIIGIRVFRQDEHRADHFAAWLTNPDWGAACLRSIARAKGAVPAATGKTSASGDSASRGLKERLKRRWALLRLRHTESHPAIEERIRRMEDLSAGKPKRQGDVPYLRP